VIRWRPILIGTDIAVGVLGSALIVSTGGSNNVLVPFLVIVWTALPLAFVRDQPTLRLHLLIASGLLVSMVAARAVEVLLLTLFLLFWFALAGLIAFRAAER
jgi:hypothetical protein